MEELESSFGVSGALDGGVKIAPAVSFTSWKRSYREKEEGPRAENDFILSDVVEAVKGELLVKSFHNGFSGVSIDSRAIKKGEIFIAISGNRSDGHNFVAEAIARGAGCIIVSKHKAVFIGDQLSAAIIWVEDTLSALISLAYWHRKRFAIPVICVTGSNGKTTTKEMLSLLLSAKYKVLKNEGSQNNSIGLSLTLLKLKKAHEAAVLELGTNHFGEIKELARIAAPNVGIITNIGPAHLEFFGDEKGVLREKWSLIEELAFPRIAVLNADDDLLKEKIALPTDVTVFTFGIKNKADWMAKKITSSLKKTSFMIKNFSLELDSPAKVNVYNGLAAFGAARIFSVDAYDIIQSFRAFKFPDSRFQTKRLDGFKLIDDAYNSNPASFFGALETFNALKSHGRKILVMGDMLELGFGAEELHRKIGRDLGRARVDMLIGVGPLAGLACEAAKASGFNPRAVYVCGSSQEARNIVSGLVRKNDTILIKGSRATRLEEIFKYPDNH